MLQSDIVYERIGWFDGVRVFARGARPLFGENYTWADDVLNLLQRANESYRGHARPERCKSWSIAKQRPCRAGAAINADGVRLAFCVRHLRRLRGKLRRRGKISVGLMADQILARVTKQTRHGAYSAVMRQQMLEAVRFRNDSAASEELRRDLEVIDSIDAEDTTSGLKELVLIVQASIARLTRKYYRGELDEMKYLQGIVLFADMQRKLLATRHEIRGSASDEVKDAIDEALDKLKLPGRSNAGDDNGESWDNATDAG